MIVDVALQQNPVMRGTSRNHLGPESLGGLFPASYLLFGDESHCVTEVRY
jgi:hypothetical protein